VGGGDEGFGGEKGGDYSKASIWEPIPEYKVRTIRRTLFTNGPHGNPMKLPPELLKKCLGCGKKKVVGAKRELEWMGRQKKPKSNRNRV